MLTTPLRHCLRFSILGLALGVVAAGCNSSGTDNSANSAPSSASNPAPAAPGAKKQIAAILMQDDQFFRLNEIGMRDAAKKYDVELLTGSATGALDKESSMVDTYTARGVGAIVVSPINPKGSAPALKRAADKGIKILTYNNALPQPFVAGGLQSDDVSLGASTGKAAAAFIQKKLGGKANIALLEYVAQSADVGKLRPSGFKAEMKKLPGVKIVAEQDAWLAPEAERVVTSLLNANPDINIIWGANEGATVGAVTAVKNAGKTGKVFVFGTDISEQLAAFLMSKDDVLQAVTGQKPYEMGYGTVEAAVKAMDGGKVDKLKIVPGQLYGRDDLEPAKAFLEQAKKLS